MARFEVYRLGHGDALALDLQSNLLDGLHTRIVAPLVRESDVDTFVRWLNPRFDIDGEMYVMLTEFLAAVPAKELREPIADLSHKADTIIAATDFLFQGF
ncbi:hypothetical protein DEM27_11545 [Metarhizobium album]|uniref:Toxin CcdB n=1 Tax=Metarhizobium album TaxID=2182425 RepID=A0A2U2DRX0_9HYPH|nr:CcdB family protein [Rhizobium album]PWE56065.1 hypothetical protein DEM27_11545 [Rhizobium album]